MSGLPEAKALRTKGPRSSPLQMVAERRSWSSLSAESDSGVAGATFRRFLVEFMVAVVSEGI